MGMLSNINTFLNVFRSDEGLLRFLYYAPIDLNTNQPDPLSDLLDDILSKDEDEIWAIRDRHIMTTLDIEDLSSEKLCRLYVYLGRRSPERNNYTLASQEIVVDVLCHNNFQKELRSLKISDRINELLIHENIAGVGKLRYVEGHEINPPKDYAAYRHVYEITVKKK
ncbi:hypothetical protein ACTXGU_00085 [Niallia sp. 01092]|uniref:hypothetical protein n=1 Tax=Niallia sp. 01092 TaxID=3457759 RepID=UPI003FD5AD88